MADTNVRSDSIDVEQIMRQIRARIREKRGVDYTEAEIQQLATVKLETFLDPKGLRSDLVEQYRRTRIVSPPPPNYTIDPGTPFDSHRGWLRAIRRALRPVVKLFFNPDPISAALQTQSAINAQSEERVRRLEDREPLSYELLHNLTFEITRLGIEVQNLRMRLESVSSRLDFDERRARSLETVVQYRPDALPRSEGAPAAQGDRQPAGRGPADAGADGGDRRRRRRRRRRRPGQTAADQQAGAGPGTDAEPPAAGGFDDDGDGPPEMADGAGDTDADDQ